MFFYKIKSLYKLERFVLDFVLSPNNKSAVYWSANEGSFDLYFFITKLI